MLAKKKSKQDTACRLVGSQIQEEISKIYLNLRSGKYTEEQKKKLRQGLAELERQLEEEKKSLENGK